MNFVMFHPTRQTFSTNKTMKVGKVFFYKPSHDITSTKKHVVNKHNIVLDQYKKKKKKTYEIGKGKQKGQKGRLWLQIQLLCFSLA